MSVWQPFVVALGYLRLHKQLTGLTNIHASAKTQTHTHTHKHKHTHTLTHTNIHILTFFLNINSQKRALHFHSRVRLLISPAMPGISATFYIRIPPNYTFFQSQWTTNEKWKNPLAFYPYRLVPIETNLKVCFKTSTFFFFSL